MSDIFPDPFKFGVGRNFPPHNKHLFTAYTRCKPFTHFCLGLRRAKLQLAFNLLTIAHQIVLQDFLAIRQLEQSQFAPISASNSLRLKVVESVSG